MMISQHEAEQLVRTQLLDKCPNSDDTLVIRDNLTRERPFGWIFFYDSKKFLETNDMQYAIAGNGPVIVNKHNGTVQFYGSGKPIQSVIDEYERRLQSDMEGEKLSEAEKG
jgi:hypothetical protein